MSKDVKIVVGIVALALITAGGVWYGLQNGKEPIDVGNGDAAENGGEVDILDVSKWKTHRNEELGFEVRYPGEWEVRESEDVPREGMSKNTILFDVEFGESGSFGREIELVVYDNRKNIDLEKSFHNFGEEWPGSERSDIVVGGVAGRVYRIVNDVDGLYLFSSVVFAADNKAFIVRTSLEEGDLLGVDAHDTFLEFFRFIR